MIHDLHFGAPLWFIALAILPLLVVLYLLARQRAAQKLSRLVAPKLAASLTQGVDHGKRTLRFSLSLLGIAALVTALARPQLGYEYQEVKRKGRDVIVAVDTSKSMLADDVTPNRLSRAKLAVQDLLRILDGDRVALVAFAGSAFLQAPLTIDYGAIEDCLAELDTNIIPRGGTNLAQAIEVSLEAFGKAEGANKALILFTDGEELDADALKAAAKAKEAGVKIFAVGVGSSAGALIPIQENGESTFVRDEAGQFVKTRLDESRLREIADLTGGFYVHLENGSDAVQTLIDRGIQKLEEKEGDQKMSRRPIERYQWPLGLALVFLMLAGTLGDRRRLMKTAAALLFAAALPQAHAVEGWHPFDKDKIEFNNGTSYYYEGKDFDKALELFGKASTSKDPEVRKRAEYNAANTLFIIGTNKLEKNRAEAHDDWKDALAHYDEALKIDPQYADAKYNRDLVEKLLKEDEQKKEDQKKQDEKDKKDQQEDQKDQQSQDQQQQQNQKDQQAKNDQQKQQQGKNGQKDSSQKSDSGQKRGDQPPTSGNQQQPSPTPDGQQKGQNQQPTPTPGEKKEGELKSADGSEKKDQKPEGQPQDTAMAEEEKDGQMSKEQARALLQSMQGEESRVNLRDNQQNSEPVSKDW